jgi:hypothetical protein
MMVGSTYAGIGRGGTQGFGLGIVPPPLRIQQVSVGVFPTGFQFQGDGEIPALEALHGRGGLAPAVEIPGQMDRPGILGGFLGQSKGRFADGSALENLFFHGHGILRVWGVLRMIAISANIRI